MAIGGMDVLIVGRTNSTQHQNRTGNNSSDTGGSRRAPNGLKNTRASEPNKCGAVIRKPCVMCGEHISWGATLPVRGEC